MASKTGKVIQVNVNPRGGVPKHGVPEATLGVGGVSGDRQRDRRFHGGPSRAVSLFAAERIAALREQGHPIEAGSTGENLTVEGLDWDAIEVGDQFHIGERALIEITGYAAPCKNIAPSFEDQDFTRMSQKLHPGWSRLYARVIVEGVVRAGDGVEPAVGE